MAVSLEAKTGPTSGRDSSDQRPDPEDIHCSGQIVGQNREGHLGGHLWESFGQEVCRSHACLDRAERMLDCLATKAHSERVHIEPLLHADPVKQASASRRQQACPSPPSTWSASR